VPSSTVGAIGCLLIDAETILRTTNSVFQGDFLIVAAHAALLRACAGAPKR
jgi:hypothetical protein